MNAQIKLSNTQRQILEHAARHSGGKLDWFPDTVKGGARGAVIDALLKRALVTRDGGGWCVTAEGYDVLCLPRPKLDAVPPAEPAQWRARFKSKQSQVIALIQRPEGATISEICALTGWQTHTARGVISGTLKKKLGLAITTCKEAGGHRVYRIEPQREELR